MLYLNKQLINHYVIGDITWIPDAAYIYIIILTHIHKVFNYITGEILWHNQFDSPVVAMYTLHAEGLQKVPFTTFAPETLDHLTGQLSSTFWKNKFIEQGKSKIF